MIEMMYVYFDKIGNIKAIADSENPQFSNFEVATFPLADVEMFLATKGAANPGDFTINKIQRLDGIKYSLVKKKIQTIPTRSLDGYLCKLSTITNKTQISITNNITDKIIKISFRQDAIEKFNAGSEENAEEILDFLNLGPVDIYITKKNNPYCLLFNVRYIPKDLFDKGTLIFKYTRELIDTSAYAKKASCGYGYKEKT